MQGIKSVFLLPSTVLLAKMGSGFKEDYPKKGSKLFVDFFKVNKRDRLLRKEVYTKSEEDHPTKGLKTLKLCYTELALILRDRDVSFHNNYLLANISELNKILEYLT